MSIMTKLISMKWQMYGLTLQVSSIKLFHHVKLKMNIPIKTLAGKAYYEKKSNLWLEIHLFDNSQGNPRHYTTKERKVSWQAIQYTIQDS